MRTIQLVKGNNETTPMCVVQISPATEAFLRALVAAAAEEPHQARGGKAPKRIEDIAAEALRIGVQTLVHRETCHRNEPSQFGALVGP